MHRESGDPERGLRDAGVGHCRLIPCLFGRIECGRRVHRCGIPRIFDEQLAQARERDEQIGEHPGTLASLTREQERDGAATRGLVAHEDLIARFECARRNKLRRQIVEIGRDERDLRRTRRALHAVTRRDGARQIAQVPRATGAVVHGEQCLQFLDRGARLGTALAPKDEQLGKPRVDRVRRFGRAVVSGEDGVKVRSAEAEAAHAGDPFFRRCRPRLRAGGEEERARRAIPRGIGPRQRARRRANAGPERERGFDHTGDAGGALCVPDLRLHRADCAASRRDAFRDEEFADRCELGAVADDGPGPVRFDQPYLGRRDPRARVRALDGEALSLRSWCGQPKRASVARSGDPANHGVDAIAVALRVGEPLENEAADAFAERDPVGLRVERTRLPGRRERVDGREQEVVLHGVVQIGAATEDHLAASARELFAGKIERGERRCARRVDGVVRPAQIETIRDATGDHVREPTRERVFGQLGDLLIEIGRKLAEVRTIARAEVVRHCEIAARFGTEDDRRAFAMRIALGVTRIAQRALRDMQREELHRFDPGQRRRGNPVREWIERDRRDEAAPLRGRAASCVRSACVLVPVHGGIPAFRRHLPERVDAADDVGPILLEIGGLRVDARHPDDRDVERRRRGGLRGRRETRRGFVDERGRAAGGLLMQCRDRRRRGAQRGDLTDHHHPLVALLVLVDGDDAVALTAQAFAGEPQAAEIQLLELAPHRLLCDAVGLQSLFGVGERAHVRRVGTARCVTRRCFEQHCLFARNRRRLERRQNRAGAHGFLREEVRGPHQNANAGTALGERRPEHRSHGSGALVVDPAGEEHLQLTEETRFILRREARAVAQQGFDLHVPEREARARSDVAAAFPTLEDELARAFAHEAVEQSGRRHVHERVDAGCLQRSRLRGTSAGDQRTRRTEAMDRLELRLAHVRGRKSQDPDAPTACAERGRRLFEQTMDVIAFHQCECEERETAGRGNLARERGAIAHTRHRSLHHGQADTARTSERRVRVEWLRRGCVGQMGLDRCAQSLHECARRHVFFGERTRERAVLADRKQVFVEPIPADARCDGTLRQRSAPDELGPVRAACREVWPRVDAVTRDHRRLASVHRRDRGTHVLRVCGLAHERELRVDDDPCRTTGDRCGGAVASETAGGPNRYRDRGVGEELLQQHERRELADASAAFATTRDQPVDAACERIVRLARIVHFSDDAAALERPLVPRRVVSEYDRRHAGRKLIRIDATTRRNANAPRLFRPAARLRKCCARLRTIAAEIENAQCARAAERSGQPRVRRFERSNAEDEIALFPTPGGNHVSLPLTEHRLMPATPIAGIFVCNDSACDHVRDRLVRSYALGIKNTLCLNPTPN